MRRPLRGPIKSMSGSQYSRCRPRGFSCRTIWILSTSFLRKTAFSHALSTWYAILLMFRWRPRTVWRMLSASLPTLRRKTSKPSPRTAIRSVVIRSSCSKKRPAQMRGFFLSFCRWCPAMSRQTGKSRFRSMRSDLLLFRLDCPSSSAYACGSCRRCCDRHVHATYDASCDARWYRQRPAPGRLCLRVQKLLPWRSY